MSTLSEHELGGKNTQNNRTKTVPTVSDRRKKRMTGFTDCDGSNDDEPGQSQINVSQDAENGGIEGSVES